MDTLRATVVVIALLLLTGATLITWMLPRRDRLRWALALLRAGMDLARPLGVPRWEDRRR